MTIRSLISISFLGGCLLTGCYTYRPINVCVQDAATGQPLESARIKTGYLVYLNLLMPLPETAEAYTDKVGMATVKLAIDGPGLEVLSVNRPGYKPSYGVAIPLSCKQPGPSGTPPEVLRISLTPLPATTSAPE